MSITAGTKDFASIDNKRPAVYNNLVIVKDCDQDIVNWLKKENKLFNRKEIKFYVDYDGEATPKVLDIKSKLVALLNTKKDLIVVDNVQPHYGEPKALGYAKVYETVDDLQYIEAKHVLAKNEEPEEEPAEDAEEE